MSTRVWPFAADWGREVRISYEFSTEVITSENGKEQRIANRTAPRMKVEFESLVPEFEFQVAAAKLHGQQNQEMLLPDWTRHVYLKEEAAVGSQALPVTRYAGWMREGMVVAVVWQGELGAQAIEVVVDAYDAILGLQLLAPITVDLPRDAFVCRTWPGRLDMKIAGRMHNDRVMTVSTRFDVEPTMENFPAAPAAPITYSGRELFLIEPDWSSDLRLDFETVMNVLDYGKGRVHRTTPVPFNTRMLQATYFLPSRTEITAMRDFFRRLRGQQGEFFMPTFTEDMRLRVDADIEASNIRLVGTHAHGMFNASAVLKNIAIVYADGEIDCYGISNAVQLDDATGKDSRFTLDRPLDRAATRKDVAMICWLPLWRMLSDELVEVWTSDEVATVGLSMKTLETLPAEVL